MNGIPNASIPSIINTRYVSLVGTGLDILLKGLASETLDSVQGVMRQKAWPMLLVSTSQASVTLTLLVIYPDHCLQGLHT